MLKLNIIYQTKEEYYVNFQICILIAIVAYLAIVVVIGVIFSRKTIMLTISISAAESLVRSLRL